MPGSSGQRDRALAALRDLIAGQTNAIFGLDFPFGLPKALVQEDNWEDFVLAFPLRYPDAAAFRQACRDAADGHELKRATDVASRTPFSPYNLRLFRQTYHGICGVLHPLVRDDLARVLPMQTPARRKPWILEVCPASTLKVAGLYMPYKGKSNYHRSARRRIVHWIEESGSTKISDAATRSEVVDDPGGDALDAVLAALAAFRAPDGAVLSPSGIDPIEAIEGHVYH